MPPAPHNSDSRSDVRAALRTLRQQDTKLAALSVRLWRFPKYGQDQELKEPRVDHHGGFVGELNPHIQPETIGELTCGRAALLRQINCPVESLFFGFWSGGKSTSNELMKDVVPETAAELAFFRNCIKHQRGQRIDS